MFEKAVFPERFSEAGFWFRFWGPGVRARPRDAEPRSDFLLCTGCGVRACRMAPVQARAGATGLLMVKLVCFQLFPKAFPKLGSRLGFGVQGLGRVRATLNPTRVFFCAQAAGFMRVGVLPCRRESSGRDFYQ